MKHILLLSLYCTIFLNAHAQESNVAYRVNTYSYSYSQSIKIKTNCEMADIIISKGISDKIDIKCTYSAKHSDKALAAKELSRHNIRVRKTLNEIYISNFFTISSNENEPKAKLKIKFEVSIPDFVTLDIQNNFGSFEINNLPCKGNIHQEFGKVSIQNGSGNLIIKGNLSEFNIQKFNGSLELRNKSGDMTADNIDGSLLFIQNSNASISLQNISNSVNVKMVLNNCEVHCKNINYNKHSVSVESYKEPIRQNSNLPIERKGDYYSINLTKALPGFIIKSTFSKLNL